MVLTETPAATGNGAFIPLADGPMNRKDYASDADARWCPGCGDYSVLAQTQRGLANLGVAPEKMVFISGIGCSSRFPYYMETYGMHSIHGRAPTIATGLKIARPDLLVFVVTGDGDALSIGGNHLLHVLRRNVDITIMLFNNRIYGLTKGQYSPTSELGKNTKTSPMGTIERSLNPLSIALAAEATFVARSFDTDPAHLTDTIEAAARHKGASFVEVLQNCNIFNDGAFREYTDKSVRDDRLIYLEHGEPMLFGPNKEKGLELTSHGLQVVDSHGPDAGLLLNHDAHRPSPDIHQLLARCEYPAMPVPMGVIRQVQAPDYGESLNEQIENAQSAKGPGDLTALLKGPSTWQVE